MFMFAFVLPLPKLKCVAPPSVATISACPSLTKISPGLDCAKGTSVQFSFCNDVKFVTAKSLNPRLYIFKPKKALYTYAIPDVQHEWNVVPTKLAGRTVKLYTESPVYVLIKFSVCSARNALAASSKFLA